MSETLARPRYRLFVEADLTEGAAVDLPQAQAHYLGTVMRAKDGETVALFNGRDGEWRAEIARVSKKAATLTVADRMRPQAPEPDVWLCFAPLKKDATDMVVQKAVELGVSRLQPVMTARTNASRFNTERARANAIEAAEQCERLTVPEVAEPVALPDLLAGWPERAPGRPLFIADETGRGTPLSDVAAGSEGAIAAFVIGPEGGFAQSELDHLRSLDFVVPVGLGPRILRAETAALAALTVWQAVRGDWRSGGPAFR
ncbi:Ribosomal RNA small subunit methyltransferase E [Caenispirillum salinarum AK4]|uniref:Ribosomal RNA small subunit methyltransferase E n=1 Tax=Caenispirillum salinarum AK4 TaxID=1238182 RepID=K9GZ13_9PROT|nr:16S rRNA (uracil(1498)-N(3))-methyltransferase [Caenispirillum salinarum]EKV30542.1 Ribosomal RNA small subunit methyltransferase E [Caenispirillum salinarum AK4]